MTGRRRTITVTSSHASLDSLVAQVRNGNAEAVAELLRESRPLVYRWAFVRTADTDDAEDVTQNVLIRVHDRIGGFEGRSSYTSWLYRITANAATELIRSRGVLERLRARVRALAPPRSTAKDPLRAIEDERTRELVRTIITRLPERQRTALDLIDLQGFTPAEAAEMESMNATTMRVHLMRARRAVRSRILEGAGRGEAETSHDE